MRRLLLAIGCAVALTRCASSIEPRLVTRGEKTVPCCSSGAGAPTTFEYLGTGGWLITHGSTHLLTAPFYSNPSLLRAGLGALHPRTSLVEREAKRLPSDVDAVLAGHAHYDHLLDLPLVLDHLPAARLYSGATAAHEMAAFGVTRSVDITGYAGTVNAAGRWITVAPHVAVMPLFSEHAAHIAHVKLYYGHYAATPPRMSRASDWLEGEPFAFLIDLLDDHNAVAFRIYYDDAAHDYPYGYPDKATLDEHPVDVAILCAASFRQTADYPRPLLDWLKPRHVLIGHWEDFFSDYDAPEKAVRLTDVPGFIDAVRTQVGDRWTMPARHAMITFAQAPRR